MKLCLLTLLLFVNNALQAQTPSLIPFKSGDKWGYLTPGKMIAIQPVYDTALPFSHGVAEVGQKGKGWGIIDTANKLLLPLTDQEFIDIGDGLILQLAMKGDEERLSVIDSNGKTLIPADYDLITAMEGTDVYQVHLHDKEGICDKNGKLIIPVEHQYISFASGQDLIVMDSNSQALYSITGQQLSPRKYMVIGEFRMRRAKMRVGDVFGFLDPMGKEVIPATYQLNFDFSEGYAVSEKNDKWGWIDTAGRETLAPTYDNLGDLDLGVAMARKGDRWGLIDRSGNSLTPFEYEKISRIYHGPIAAQKNGKWAVLSLSGQPLTPFTYDTILIRQADELQVRDFGNKASADDDPGYLLVGSGEHWGAVDPHGKLILPAVYDEIYPFHHGTCPVKKGDKWALADSSGTILTDFIYDRLECSEQPFYTKNHRMGLLSRQGKQIGPEYDAILPTGDHYYLVAQAGKVGVIDGNVKIILPIKYERIVPKATTVAREKCAFAGDLCLVRCNGIYGYVDKKGVEYFK